MKTLIFLILLTSFSALAQQVTTVPNPQILIDATESKESVAIDKHLKSSPIDSVVCKAQENTILLTSLMNQVNYLRFAFNGPRFLAPPQFPVIPRVNFPRIAPMGFNPQIFSRSPAGVVDQNIVPAAAANLPLVPTEVATSTQQ